MYKNRNLAKKRVVKNQSGTKELTARERDVYFTKVGKVLERLFLFNSSSKCCTLKTWFKLFPWNHNSQVLVTEMPSNQKPRIRRNCSFKTYSFKVIIVLIFSAFTAQVAEAAIEGVQASVDALKLLSGGWCLKQKQ